MITYNTNVPELQQLLDLYNNVGWTAYTNDSATLQQAMAGSLFIATAWDGDNAVGLIRAIGDGHTILYIQDILVYESYQRKGIATKLMELLMNTYPNVRQKVLLTDDTSRTRGFYKALGFTSCDDGRLVAFAKLSNTAQ